MHCKVNLTCQRCVEIGKKDIDSIVLSISRLGQGSRQPIGAGNNKRGYRRRRAIIDRLRTPKSHYPFHPPKPFNANSIKTLVMMIALAR